MTKRFSLRALTKAPHARAVIALIAAMLAVIIDFIVRFGNYRDLLNLLPHAGPMKFTGALVLVFLQMIAFFYLILLLPRLLRTIVFLLSVFVLVVQFSYWMTLGQFMTSTDLFLAMTVSAGHLEGAVSSFVTPRIFWYTLPHAMVLFALILAPRAPGFHKLLLLILLPASYLLASNYALFLHAAEGNYHLNPLTSFLRTTIHHKFEILRAVHGPREDLPAVGPSRQRPLDSIIYIIDESVRGSNLSLNGYPRDTTPFLQSLESRGCLRNFGICVAAGTYSFISNAYLVTGHNAFPDDGFRTFRNPTLFDYAKKMGYETLYIDIDNGYLSTLLETSPEGRVRSLDRWMTDKTFRERHIDLDTTKDLGVADFLSGLLNERGGYFILVNKKGLHFHYRNTYPDDSAFAFWKPVMKVSERVDPRPTGREKLVNTYDNGIRFQVDEFFRKFVSDTTNMNYILLYTSDHGQTLAEDGQLYTHMKPDKVIADVPLFLVVGERYDKTEALAGIRLGIRVSHLNNFATILDLMDVPAPLRIRPYEKSIFALTTEDNRERYFLSGSLHGSGDYVVKRIPTPPDKGWGISRPVGNGSEAE